MFESRFGSRSRRSAGRANKELLEEAFGPSSRGNEEREGANAGSKVGEWWLGGAVCVLGIMLCVCLAGW
jgi:hypothetical protein